MVIITLTLCFAAAFVFTQSYKFIDKYYPTVLYVSSMSAMYQLLCRGHLVWYFRNSPLFPDKLSSLTQISVLFPCTTVLFLRYLPSRYTSRVLHFLGFFGVYVAMELFLKRGGEIVYQYGWTFWWSVFIDFCLFALAWIHSVNWKVALPISTIIVVFLMVWFRVPLDV